MTAMSSPHIAPDRFFITSEEQVDAWYGFLSNNSAPIKSPPKTHRDGARSIGRNHGPDDLPSATLGLT